MALFSTETGDRIFWTHVRRHVFSGSTHGINRSSPPPRPPPSLMNPGYLPGKLMCAYHVFVRPLYQRNGVTFDKIGYYYPFLLSPQGVARPALARCFVSSSFNCSSRDRQVFVELGGGGKKGKKRTGGIPLDIRLLFFRLCIKYPRERELDTCLFSSTLK